MDPVQQFTKEQFSLVVFWFREVTEQKSIRNDNQTMLQKHQLNHLIFHWYTFLFSKEKWSGREELLAKIMNIFPNFPSDRVPVYSLVPIPKLGLRHEVAGVGKIPSVKILDENYLTA